MRRGMIFDWHVVTLIVPGELVTDDRHVKFNSNVLCLASLVIIVSNEFLAHTQVVVDADVVFSH